MAERLPPIRIESTGARLKVFGPGGEDLTRYVRGVVFDQADPNKMARVTLELMANRVEFVSLPPERSAENAAPRLDGGEWVGSGPDPHLIEAERQTATLETIKASTNGGFNGG